MFLRILTIFWLFSLPAAAEAPLVVFAASSLAGPLDEVAEAWDGEIVISYAGSATLARQLGAGAPADIVILANEDWMLHLETLGAVEGTTIRPILGNTLILARAADTAPGDLRGALAGLPTDARIATGFTDAVPVGIYARQTLEHLELWADISPRMVQVENARLALALVARGDVEAALIYRSDAVAEPRVTEVAAAPPHLHDPIFYMAALSARTGHPEAAGFLDHLRQMPAQTVFAAAGFIPIP